MVKPKIEYDLKEASWKFAFLKFMEISLFLIFIFGFYTVAPSYANFRDNEMVTKELIMYANTISERETK